LRKSASRTSTTQPIEERRSACQMFIACTTRAQSRALRSPCTGPSAMRPGRRSLSGSGRGAAVAAGGSSARMGRDGGDGHLLGGSEGAGGVAGVDLARRRRETRWLARVVRRQSVGRGGERALRRGGVERVGGRARGRRLGLARLGAVGCGGPSGVGSVRAPAFAVVVVGVAHRRPNLRTGAGSVNAALGEGRGASRPLCARAARGTGKG
jgi:hypothetical protein